METIFLNFNKLVIEASFKRQAQEKLDTLVACKLWQINFGIFSGKLPNIKFFLSRVKKSLKNFSKSPLCCANELKFEIDWRTRLDPLLLLLDSLQQPVLLWLIATDDWFCSQSFCFRMSSMELYHYLNSKTWIDKYISSMFIKHWI